MGYCARRARARGEVQAEEHPRRQEQAGAWVSVGLGVGLGLGVEVGDVRRTRTAGTRRLSYSTWSGWWLRALRWGCCRRWRGCGSCVQRRLMGRGGGAAAAGVRVRGGVRSCRGRDEAHGARGGGAVVGSRDG